MVTTLLRETRNADGGFGVRARMPSEAEPTALAALALEDDEARSWLVGEQRDDGGVGLRSGSVVNEAATALAALALRPGAERERALDRLEGSRAAFHPSTQAIPIDPDAVGWSWTTATASWTEPTARALLALRLLRPRSSGIDDAVGLLRDREAVGGGWNYGNRVVLEEELPPFAQTTAIALIGLLRLDEELERRGVLRLRELWRQESGGGLNLATSAVALRLHGDDEGADAQQALDRLVAETGLRGDGIALGWAALAESRVWGAWAP
jgi:hypothetical protein